MWFKILYLNIFCKRQHSEDITNTPFTWYNRLSNRLYNRFDNHLYRTNKHPTGCQPGLTTVLNEQTVRSTRLSNRLSNRIDNQFDNGFDNRLYRVYKHLPGCQTGLTTGFAVWQPVWQQVVSCKRGLSVVAVMAFAIEGEQFIK